MLDPSCIGELLLEFVLCLGNVVALLVEENGS
jgi:hypothetical protein